MVQGETGVSLDRAVEPAPEYGFPMTLTQQAFWYLDRVQRGNPAWNIAVRFQVAGALDARLLQAAVEALVARQDMLRTTFHIGLAPFGEDTPVQVVHATMPVVLEVYDLTHLSGDARDASADEQTLREAERSFDLATGPLIRAALLRLGAEDHILLLTVHHIIADGWSIGVLADELTALYAALAGGVAPALPELAIQFADYAVWKQEQAAGGPGESDRRYWAERLRALGPCEIAPDYPRPEIPAHKAHILSTLLPAELTEALAARAREQGCTLFTAAMAALKLLVHRVTGNADVYVGTLLAGRDQVELEPLVGVFVNTLVMRTRVEEQMRFDGLLAAVRQTVEEGMAHQAMPFSQLTTQLRLKPRRGCSHFYSINFIFQRDFVKPWRGAGLTVTALPSRTPGAIYDLNFFMVQRAEGWRFSCEYDRELYAAETVARLLEHFGEVVEQVTRDPRMRVGEVRLPERVRGRLAEGAPGRYLPPTD